MSELTLPVDLTRDHSQGHAGATVTLVEYGDYECPYCGRAHPIVQAVQTAMGERLRFVFRNFPLTTIHPHAQRAAESAEAAATQGKFWEMHHALFAHQKNLSDRHLRLIAEEIGIDPDWLIQELDNGTFAERVREDFRSGVRSGVNGTPTFFINGFRYDGEWDKETLLQALENA
jgi:protein-disulfide isomerase